jgi:O-6-methylguanine DNA methyltransferase
LPAKKDLPIVFYGSKPHKRLGLLWAGVTERGLWSASYGIDEVEFRAHILARGDAIAVHSPAKVAAALKQMAEFLAGKRRRFELKVDWSEMTPFQVAVRKAVMAVPYGETASYGDIAAAVGRPLAPRAVGAVQATNPISFVIPAIASSAPTAACMVTAASAGWRRSAGCWSWSNIRSQRAEPLRNNKRRPLSRASLLLFSAAYSPTVTVYS